jgi:hypothetical protein
MENGAALGAFTVPRARDIAGSPPWRHLQLEGLVFAVDILLTHVDLACIVLQPNVRAICLDRRHTEFNFNILKMPNNLVAGLQI